RAGHDPLDPPRPPPVRPLRRPVRARLLLRRGRRRRLHAARGAPRPRSHARRPGLQLLVRGPGERPRDRGPHPRPHGLEPRAGRPQRGGERDPRAVPERGEGPEALRLAGAVRPRQRPRAHDRLVPGLPQGRSLTERPLAGRAETRRAALALTLGVLALGALVLAVYTLVFRPAPFAVDPAETRFWGPHGVSTHLSLIKPCSDARGQTLAHLAMAGAPALVVLFGSRLRARRILDRRGGAAAVTVAVAAFAAPLYAPGPKLAYFAAGIPLFALVAFGGRL